jgi:hypothetical protein
LNEEQQYISLFRDAINLSLEDFDKIGPQAQALPYQLGDFLTVAGDRGSFSGTVTAVASSWLIINDGQNDRIVCPSAVSSKSECPDSFANRLSRWPLKMFSL